MPFKAQFLLLITGLLLTYSCSDKQKKEVVLYNTYCASCHKAPKIGELPKHIWENNVLPRMAARMGIKNSGFDYKEGHSFSEQAAILKSGIYPTRQIISDTDWKLLHDYIIALAPDSLTPGRVIPAQTIEKFKVRAIDLDENPTSLYSYMNYDDRTNELLLGTLSSHLIAYDFAKDSSIIKNEYKTPIVDYYQNDSVVYATVIGKLPPTEQLTGGIFKTVKESSEVIANQLHRPVNTLVKDLNGDGQEELVVSEFGHLTGRLSLLTKNNENGFNKNVILNQPGIVRTLAKDMNGDSKLDLVVASSQGDESIYILYQEDDLQFWAEKVLRFSPVYGTSWFELIDYDGDGDDDIITANGDNADDSYINKPYHGIRIHINDGSNHFTEKYFYPMNGATRILANDFDADGDIDIAIIATFPNYGECPVQSFNYLENTSSSTFDFTAYTFEEMNWGRWFLMDAADVDFDGDLDIVLSAFSFPFTTTPKDMFVFWKEKHIDLLVLENQLKNN